MMIMMMAMMMMMKMIIMQEISGTKGVGHWERTEGKTQRGRGQGGIVILMNMMNMVNNVL